MSLIWLIAWGGYPTEGNADVNLWRGRLRLSLNPEALDLLALQQNREILVVTRRLQ